MEEGRECPFRAPRTGSGFLHVKAAAGESVACGDQKGNHLVFVNGGTLAASVEQYRDCPVFAGEMIYFPGWIDMSLRASSAADLLFIRLDSVRYPCLGAEAERLCKNRAGSTSRFGGVPIKPPLAIFISQISNYIHSEIRCFHMHDIKQKELALIIKHYYTDEEKIRLFYYSLANDIAFAESVHRNFREVKTVAELASRLGYSEKTFEKMFFHCFSTTPYKWMQQQTALLLRDRLIDTSVPLKQIMAEFNFSTPSHFNVYCKRLLGANPSEFRKRKDSVERK